MPIFDNLDMHWFASKPWALVDAGGSGGGVRERAQLRENQQNGLSLHDMRIF